MKVTHFLWVDLEMTGPDVEQDRIIEAAAILTDTSLEGIDTFTAVVDPSPYDYVERIASNPKVQQMHIRNGLVGDLTAGHGIGLEKAERSIVDMIPTKGRTAMLAGSIDPKWIERWMPSLAVTVAYRSMDITGLRRFFSLICKREDLLPDEPDLTHRALKDITHHLDECRHYQALVGHIPEYGYV